MDLAGLGIDQDKTSAANPVDHIGFASDRFRNGNL